MTSRTKEEADPLSCPGRCRDMGYCITNPPAGQVATRPPGSGEADKHTGRCVPRREERGRIKRVYSPLVQLQQSLCLPRFALRLRLHRLLVLVKHPLKLLVRPILEEVCSDGRRHCTRIGASWSRVSSRTANLEEWRECAGRRAAGEAAPPGEAAGCPQSCQPCGLTGGGGGSVAALDRRGWWWVGPGPLQSGAIRTLWRHPVGRRWPDKACRL